LPALHITFGLALYAHACFVLGILGQFRPGPILALTVVFAIASLRLTLPTPRLAWLAFVPLFLLALYPPIEFDETLYHLPFVQAFARDGAVRFLPDLRFPVFPVLHEVLCVPPFLLAGDVATHFVSVVEVLLIVALLVEWDARAGWLAAAMFLGSPLVVKLATVLHVEMALTLFVVAGFHALDRERYVLAGFFFGSACSVKYLGFSFALAALIVVIFRRGRVAVFALACALTALPMTAWIYFHTRDPLFPFLTTEGWTPSPSIPLEERATRLARLIWDVTFARERVGMQPPVTPLLALFIVAILVAAVKRDAFARIVLLLGAGYVVLFTFMPQDSRYLVPLLVLVCVAAARFVATRWPKSVTLLALLAIAPGVAYAGYRLVRQGVPPATPSQHTEWLAERVPEYRALRLAGTERVYACRGEQLKSYAAGELLGDHMGPWSYARILTGAGDTQTIAERMRRIDVRYYLVAKRACAPPRANGGMELVYEDAGAQLWRVGARSRAEAPAGGEDAARPAVGTPALHRMQEHIAPPTV
jgi:hypothetical protein